MVLWRVWGVLILYDHPKGFRGAGALPILWARVAVFREEMVGDSSPKIGRQGFSKGFRRTGTMPILWAQVAGFKIGS